MKSWFGEEEESRELMQDVTFSVPDPNVTGTIGVTPCSFMKDGFLSGLYAFELYLV